MAILGGGNVSEGEIDLDKSVAYGDGDSRPFAPVKPGRYTAVVRSLKSKTYRAGYGAHKSGDADGKWTYLSLTPDVVLANPEGTIINRQDLTVGVIDAEGNTFRPDGDTSKPSIFGGERGAQYFLTALGLVGSDGKLIPFDTDNIKNRVVVVNVGLAAYQRGSSGQKGVEELAGDFAKIKPDWTMADLPELMRQLNIDEGLLAEDEDERDVKNLWRLKNVITGFYRLKADEAEARGYAVLGNQVFLSSNDKAEYEAALKGVKPNKPQRKPSL